MGPKSQETTLSKGSRAQNSITQRAATERKSDKTQLEATQDKEYTQLLKDAQIRLDKTQLRTTQDDEPEPDYIKILRAAEAVMKMAVMRDKNDFRSQSNTGSSCKEIYKNHKVTQVREGKQRPRSLGK